MSRNNKVKAAFSKDVQSFFDTWVKYDVNCSGTLSVRELKNILGDTTNSDKEAATELATLVKKYGKDFKITVIEFAEYCGVDKAILKKKENADLCKNKQWKTLIKNNMSGGGKSEDKSVSEKKYGGSSSEFACWGCDKSLLGYRYVLREDHPYCIQCYEQNFAKDCEECGNMIGTNSKDMSYRDKHWHDDCFKCSNCQNSLVGQEFSIKEEKLYCGDCNEDNFSSRCDSCDKPFKGGSKKLEWRGKSHHEECFVCSVCNNQIGTESFVPKDDNPYCVECYEDRFATRCTTCDKSISKGGVSYRGQPYHRECFTCTDCDKSLAGQRFTTKDDLPICSDCFGDKYANKCERCNDPITQKGGVMFEDQHWHHDCFECTKCQSNLVGRGFICQGDDTLCYDCGRTW